MNYIHFLIYPVLWSTADEIPISINISVNEITKTAMAISPKSSFLKNLVRIDICPNLAHAFTTALSESPFNSIYCTTHIDRDNQKFDFIK